MAAGVYLRKIGVKSTFTQKDKGSKPEVNSSYKSALACSLNQTI